MSKEKERCTAVTKAGTRCKNMAQPGSPTCHVHHGAASHESAQAEQGQFQAIMAQMNELARLLQERVPAYTPPPYSPQELLRLLKENMHRFTPEMRLDILRDLQQGLRSPSAKDLLDFETWKGMWFILNYSVQHESRSLLSSLAGRLSKLPGAGVVTELAGMFEGATVKDFLDLDTWKGIGYVLNYSLQHEASQLKNRLLGEEETLESE